MLRFIKVEETAFFSERELQKIEYICNHCSGKQLKKKMEMWYIMDSHYVIQPEFVGIKLTCTCFNSV